MNDTVNLLDFFRTLKRRWKWFVFIALLVPLIGGLATTFLLTPVYQGTTMILVNQKSSENQIDLSQLQGHADLINTYGVIIKSPAILERVISDLELNQSVDELNNKIKISSMEDSQIFSLTVEDPDEAVAVKIANAVSETFKKEIANIMNIDNVSILAMADEKANPVPVKPNLFFNLIVSLAIGILTGTGAALLADMMDNTLKDSQDTADYLGLPILGSIQKMEGESKGSEHLERKWIGGRRVES